MRISPLHVALVMFAATGAVAFGDTYTFSMLISESGKLTYTLTDTTTNSTGGTPVTLSATSGAWDGQANTNKWTLPSQFTWGANFPTYDSALIVTEPGAGTGSAAKVSDLVVFDGGSGGNLAQIYVYDAPNTGGAVTPYGYTSPVGGYTGDLSTVAGLTADLDNNHALWNITVGSEVLNNGSYAFSYENSAASPAAGSILYNGVSLDTTVAFTESVPLPTSLSQGMLLLTGVGVFGWLRSRGQRNAAMGLLP